MRKGLLAGGGLLVLIGVLIVALRYVKLGAAATTSIGIAGLFLMSLSLLAYYVESHVLPALIPGGLLAGLGLGILLAHLFGQMKSPFILGGLGAGFFSIAILDAIVARRRQTWAVIPGTVLLALGALLALASIRGVSQSFGVLAGSILLIAGVYLAVRLARGAKKT